MTQKTLPEPPEFTGSSSDEITWNHSNFRVMRQGNEFAIFEAFYDSHGELVLWEAEPHAPSAQTSEALLKELQSMFVAFRHPVLDYGNGEGVKK